MKYSYNILFILIETVFLLHKLHVAKNQDCLGGKNGFYLKPGAWEIKFKMWPT